jgi:hypothetical protein
MMLAVMGPHEDVCGDSAQAEASHYVVRHMLNVLRAGKKPLLVRVVLEEFVKVFFAKPSVLLPFAFAAEGELRDLRFNPGIEFLKIEVSRPFHDARQGLERVV